MFHLIGYLIGLFGFAIALAAAARRLGIPGAGLVAGAVAGLLLGPTLLGRVAPGWFEAAIAGGQKERLLLDNLSGEFSARELARREAGLAPDPAAEAEQRRAIASAEAAWHAARWRDQQALRITTLCVAGFFLLVAGATRPAAAGPRPHLYQTLSVGFWSAILPGALFIIVLLWMDVTAGMAIAASASIACGAVIFAPGDLAAADDAEVGGARLLVSASRLALVIAMALLASGCLLLDASKIFWIAAPCAAGILAWILPRVEEQRAINRRDAFLTPVLVALLAIRIEFFAHFSLGMILAALILSGDGRWFGAFLGAMLSGARRSLRTMRLVLGVMGAGSAQVALAAIALAAGIVPEEAAYALLAGALLMEITTNTRRRMARRIEETEESLQEMQEMSDDNTL